MVNFAYATPDVPFVPDVPMFAGVGLSWTGWDGSEWALTDPDSGRFLMPGVRGLLMPDFTRHSSSSNFVAGSRHRGSSVQDRECFWPLHEFSDAGSADFLKWNRAFWKTLDPDREGTWRTHLPDGGSRSLRCRFLKSDDVLDNDPVLRGWQSTGITLLADNPYWRGEPVRRSWGQPELRNYYVTAEDRTTYGYADDVIHYLSPGGSLGTASITNDGDVPAYPVWTVVGPTTSVSFGVDGAVVSVPFAIPAGKAVRLDTDPVNGQVLWFGDWSEDHFAVTSPVDRTADLVPSSKFVAVPAGEDRGLSITMTGTGTVIAELIPQFRRGF